MPFEKLRANGGSEASTNRVMTLDVAESALVCAGVVLEWALALYVLTRGGWTRVPVLAALAMAALVVYHGGVGLALVAHSMEAATLLLRATWLGPALLPALWLALTAALAADEGPEAQRGRLRGAFQVAAILGLGLGLFFAAAGMFTDLVRVWGPAGQFAPGPTQEQRASAPGPLFPAYSVYLVGSSLWALWNVVALWRASAAGTPLRARWRWLLLTALLFLAAAGYLGMASSDLALTGIPGDVLLIAGMLVMGWTIARYGALVAGEVVAGDVIAFSLSMAGVVGAYTLLAAGLLPRGEGVLGAWVSRWLPLVLVAMATHVLVSRQSLWLERLVYGPARGTLRDRLRALAARVVRQPDELSALVEVRESMADMVMVHGDLTPAAHALHGPPASPAGEGRHEVPGTVAEAERAPQGQTASGGAQRGELGTSVAGEIQPHAEAAAPAEFRVLVEGALRRLNSVPELSRHPLLEVLVPSVPGSVPGQGAGGALERAARLRDELAGAIARLRPAGARPNPGAHGAAGGWLHFLVLHEAYVEGRPNKEIMQRYVLSEGTFHRARRRAVDAVALDLYPRAR